MPEVVETGLLTCLLHCIAHLLVGKLLSAVYINAVYLDLILLVDLDINDDAVVAGHVGTLDDPDLGILITLVIIVVLDDLFGTVNDVRSNLVTLENAYLHLDILFLALLDTKNIQLRHTGTLVQRYTYIYIVALDTVGSDDNILKESVFPETLDGIGHSIARYGNDITYRKA